MTETIMLTREMLDMISEGMEPLDCLLYAMGEGKDYPDAVYLVTRALNLDDEGVFELELDYRFSQYSRSMFRNPARGKL